MTHEAQMHELNCSLTLTYNDVSLPENGSLLPGDHQKFIKRLRRKFGKLRYFHCGEYGEKHKRPHYHTLLFGLDFLDKYPFSTSRSGHPLFTSDTLNDVWGHGYCYIGQMNFQTAQYAAKYATKVLTVSDKTDKDTYDRFHRQFERIKPSTGEIVTVEPEYVTMSGKPGLGQTWFEKYWRDVYPWDEIVLNGRTMPVPRYYDKLLEEQDPEMFERVKKKRLRERDRSDDNPSRLRQKEVCALAKNNQFGGRTW